jgi:hypothetical protein
MKKTVKAFLCVAAALLALLWFVRSTKNTFDDGYGSGLLLMIALVFFNHLTRTIPKDNPFKRLSWFGLLVLAFFGIHGKKNFSEGFSAGVIISLGVWILYPVAHNALDAYLVAKEARKTPEQRQAEELARQSRLKAYFAKRDNKEKHANQRREGPGEVQS